MTTLNFPSSERILEHFKDLMDLDRSSHDKKMQEMDLPSKIAEFFADRKLSLEEASEHFNLFLRENNFSLALQFMAVRVYGMIVAVGKINPNLISSSL